MLRSIVGKLMSVGRTASAGFGLVLVLALIVGAAYMAYISNGHPFSSTKGTTLNAEKLEDLHPVASLTGDATAFQGKANIAPGSKATFLILSQPRLRLTYVCPADLSDMGDVILRNTGTSALNVMSEREGSPANTQYDLLAPGDAKSRPPEVTGDHITFQAQGQAVATIDVFSVHRTTAGGFSTNDCHVQAQALVTTS
jgi:hypothetical protein